MLSLHDVHECFHSSITGCFPADCISYTKSIYCQSRGKNTAQAWGYQAQIPEELKEAPAPLNEMQPLPKCFVSLPRTTNTPIILKLEQMHVTGEELFIRPKT